MQIKPFLKWVGGKTKLLNEIDQRLPDFVKNSSFNYVEPFLGGGAVFFHLISKYNIKKSYLNDLNNKLIRTYIDVRDNSDKLIKALMKLESSYYQASDKKDSYLKKRTEFNKLSLSVKKSALFILLNKTCFNGMYRENSKGQYNIPFGDMKDPKICDKVLIENISKLLNENDIEFSSKSFEDTLIEEKNVFYYLDPPYRPISETSHFTSYTKNKFDDELQLKLKDYCDEVDCKESFFMQSNSYSTDSFFQNLYTKFNVDDVSVARTISADSSKRDKIKEIIIFNYD